MKLISLAVGLSCVFIPPAAKTVWAQSEIAPRAVDVHRFADTAASLNMFELQASQLVINRSKNEDVIALAKQTIADRTAAGGAIMAAARQEEIAPSPLVLERHQIMLDELASAEDIHIDQAYIDAQMAAHEEAIALFEYYLTEGDEGAMKIFAGEALPVFRQHQTLITTYAEIQLRAEL